MMTAADLCSALDGRYAQRSAGTAGEAWVTIREARSGAGFKGNDRQCDYLAINTWQSRGLQIIGHEVKVSMADWRKELAQPEKAQAFARYCRRWWIVMPSALAAKAKHEMPPMWGLMSVSDAGRTTELIAAPVREPDMVPVPWWVGWLAQVDRRDRRAAQADIDRLVAERVEVQRQSWERNHTARRSIGEEATKALGNKVNAFRAATGIDVRHARGPDVERLGQLWRTVKETPALDVLAKHLREAADGLDALAVTPASEQAPV